MEFENTIMKIILRYCNENKLKSMTAEDAWQIAKRISIVSMLKTKKEINNKRQSD